MIRFVLFVALLALTGTRAQLSENCLSCLCAVSNGCGMPSPPCIQFNWGLFCSPWLFSEPYWIDGGNLGGGDIEKCASDWDCSESTVRAYLTRYAGSSASCQTYARTHIGGPQGATDPSTMDYWHEVEECINRGVYTQPPKR